MMTFAQFAKFLEKLEATPSRLSLIKILAELFKEAKSSEIPQITYLIQGRVAPFYEPLELGMSEKLVASSIAKAYDSSKEQVLKEYAKAGDLGKVAQKLSFPQKRESIQYGSRIKSGMTVKEVFETLVEIAETSGTGAVEKKVSLLSGLLTKLDSSSAKHLVRIPLGTSRLGIGDPTILDAFAQTKLGDKSKRKILEEAYNKTSDLGLIGQTLWARGAKGVESLDVSVGRPIRSELAERLPDAKTILEKLGGEVHVQKKFDGFRVQIHKKGSQVWLFSRNLEETTPMFPEIVAGAKKQIKAQSAILDSEAMAFNPSSDEFLPFQETTKRRRKYEIEEMVKKLPLKAFVFDIMYLNGKSLINKPLRERMEILKKVISGDEVLASSPLVKRQGDEPVLIVQLGEITKSAERLEELFNEAVTRGFEGLLIKRPDSKYEAGARNFNWVKLKRHSAGELKDTIDCVILGYIFGKGKRAGFGAGSLLVGVYNEPQDEFVTVSKIGTGLTDEEWREIHRRADKIKMEKRPARVLSLIEPTVWIKPEIVIEVLADEITKSPIHTAGYALRFPRLIRFREEDKRAEDATTVKELLEMYELQFKKL